jgi:hypothetical protein
MMVSILNYRPSSQFGFLACSSTAPLGYVGPFHGAPLMGTNLYHVQPSSYNLMSTTPVGYNHRFISHFPVRNQELHTKKSDSRPHALKSATMFIKNLRRKWSSKHVSQQSGSVSICIYPYNTALTETINRLCLSMPLHSCILHSMRV